ncbi:hypothetical protein GSI_14141 [Ganoderma sinense ZZ0214-1]|uniref:Uncharacterized protein n=1 Tax=Ganoderma sinense ZZ0214-1 TaxID=1077348 RepID=A0A2G8RSR9_9APHY|nr:hypothetical protein GSI_14141 [Ganoderma sinense ZZ0214-1]
MESSPAVKVSIAAQDSVIPSLPAQPFFFPSDRQFPLYAHCNSQRPVRRVNRHRSNGARRTPSRRNDLRTVDNRLPPLKQRRSSFALSAAFERDGRVEFVVSSKLPPTPRSGSRSVTSVSTTSSVRSRMKAVLVDLVHTVKAKCHRNRSLPRILVVEPAD